MGNYGQSIGIKRIVQRVIDGRSHLIHEMEAIFDTGHRGNVSSLAVASDGRQIALASRDNKITLWNVETSQPHRVCAPIRAHRSHVLTCIYHPDANKCQCATAGADGHVKIWCTKTGKLIAQTDKHEKHACSVKWIEYGGMDAKFLASASQDGRVAVWDQKDDTGKLKLLIEQKFSAY